MVSTWHRYNDVFPIMRIGGFIFKDRTKLSFKSVINQFCLGGEKRLRKPVKVTATGSINNGGVDSNVTSVLDFGNGVTSVCVTSSDARMQNNAEVGNILILACVYEGRRRLA